MTCRPYIEILSDSLNFRFSQTAAYKCPLPCNLGCNILWKKIP